MAHLEQPHQHAVLADLDRLLAAGEVGAGDEHLVDVHQAGDALAGPVHDTGGADLGLRDAFSLIASGRTVASKVARNSSAKSGVIFAVAAASVRSGDL